ncbi:MAG: hypothetical protein U1F24_02870 [Alphaproteobacteria bacterium]
MQFNIDEDRGDYLSGWLLPDNPSREPRIVAVADQKRATIAPSLVHSNMVDSGLHDTGLCGFELHEAALPGLASARDVRLYDEDTGLLIYVRRGPRAYVEAKLFTFDSRGSAQSCCTAAFAAAFHMAYPDADQIPHETRKACIDLRFTTSLFVGGPVQFRAIEPFLRNKGYRLTAMLADPAELLFSLVMPPRAAADPDAPRRLAAALSGLDERSRAALRDPLTKQLTLIHRDDALDRDAVAQALDTLSYFDAVGIEARAEEFVTLVAAVCETEPRLLGRVAARPPMQLAAALRREETVRDLIGRDLDIYDAVADALAAVQDGS